MEAGRQLEIPCAYLKYFILTFFFFLKKARLDSGSFRTKPNIWEAGHIWMVDRLTRHPDVWGQAGLWSSLYPGDVIKGT